MGSAASARNAIKTATKKAILESLRNGASITVACKAAGIDYTTYYRWYNRFRKFRAQVDATKLTKVGIAKDTAFECMLKAKDDPRYQTSLIAWLNNEGDWRNQTNLNVSTAKAPREMTTDELMAIASRGSDHSGSGDTGSQSSE